MKSLMWENYDPSVKRWRIVTRCAAFLAQIFDSHLLDINGFLSIIEPCPLFSMADDFAGRHFSPSFYFTHLSVSSVCAQGIIFVAETASNNQPRYSLPLRLRLASRIDASGHFFPQNCVRTGLDLVILFVCYS